jgi:hypothetical protein
MQHQATQASVLIHAFLTIVGLSLAASFMPAGNAAAADTTFTDLPTELSAYCKPVKCKPSYCPPPPRHCPGQQ